MSSLSFVKFEGFPRLSYIPICSTELNPLAVLDGMKWDWDYLSLFIAEATRHLPTTYQFIKTIKFSFFALCGRAHLQKFQTCLAMQGSLSSWPGGPHFLSKHLALQVLWAEQMPWSHQSLASAGPQILHSWLKCMMGDSMCLHQLCSSQCQVMEPTLQVPENKILLSGLKGFTGLNTEYFILQNEWTEHYLN